MHWEIGPLLRLRALIITKMMFQKEAVDPKVYLSYASDEKWWQAFPEQPNAAYCHADMESHPKCCTYICAPPIWAKKACGPHSGLGASEAVNKLQPIRVQLLASVWDCWIGRAFFVLYC